MQNLNKKNNSRGHPGIEPGTSRTLSENYTIKPMPPTLWTGDVQNEYLHQLISKGSDSLGVTVKQQEQQVI